MAYITIDEKQAKIKDYIHKHCKGRFNAYSILKSDFEERFTGRDSDFLKELIKRAGLHWQEDHFSHECTILFAVSNPTPFTDKTETKTIKIIVCYNNTFDTVTNIDTFITDTFGDAIEKKMEVWRPYYFEEFIKEFAICADYTTFISNEVEPVVINSQSGLRGVRFFKHPELTWLFKYCCGTITEQELVDEGLGL